MEVLNYNMDKNNEFFDDNLLHDENLMSMDCFNGVQEFVSSFDDLLHDYPYEACDNIFPNLMDFKSEDLSFSFDLNSFEQIADQLSEDSIDSIKINESILNNKSIYNPKNDLDFKNNTCHEFPNENKTMNNYKNTNDLYIQNKEYDSSKVAEVIVLNKSVKNNQLSMNKIENELTNNQRQFFKNEPKQLYTKSVLLRSQNKNNIHMCGNNINSINKPLKNEHGNNLKTSLNAKDNLFSNIIKNRQKNLNNAFLQKSYGIKLISNNNYTKHTYSTNAEIKYKPKTFTLRHLTNTQTNESVNTSAKIINQNNSLKNEVHIDLLSNINISTNMPKLNLVKKNKININSIDVDLYKKCSNDDKTKSQKPNLNNEVNISTKILANINRLDCYTNSVSNAKEFEFNAAPTNNVNHNLKNMNLITIENLNNQFDVNNMEPNQYILEDEMIITNNIDMSINPIKESYSNDEVLVSNLIDDKIEVKMPNDIESNKGNLKVLSNKEPKVLNQNDESKNAAQFCEPENIVEKASIVETSIINANNEDVLDQGTPLSLLPLASSLIDFELEDSLSIATEIEIDGETKSNIKDEVHIELDMKPKKKLSLKDYKNIMGKRKFVNVDMKKQDINTGVEMYDYSLTEDHTYSCISVKLPEAQIIKCKQEVSCSINNNNVKFKLETMDVQENKCVNYNSVIKSTLKREFEPIKNENKKPDPILIKDEKLLNYENLKCLQSIANSGKKLICDKITRPSLKSQMLMEVSMKEKLKELSKRNSAAKAKSNSKFNVTEEVNLIPSPNYADYYNNYSYDDISSISSDSASERYGEKIVKKRRLNEKCEANSKSRRLKKTREGSEDSAYSRSSSLSYNSQSMSNWQLMKWDECKRLSHLNAVNERRIVYVGNIPSCFTKYDLKNSLKSFGKIIESSVHYQDSGKYGFVTFSKSSEAEHARQNGHTLIGCQNFNFNYGGRRDFCISAYTDLDDDQDYDNNFYPKEDSENTDFQSLLQDTLKMLKNKI